MRAVIFANGFVNPEQHSIPDPKPGDVIIAADGGARNSLLYGLRPDILIGDLDSISEQDKENLSSQGIKIISFARDKDQTDLELALDYATQIGAEETILFGLLGGRLDQTLANLLLLSRDAYASMKLVISADPDTAHFMRNQDAITIQGEIKDIVSLVPLSSTVTGVTTHGLRWPLKSAPLEFGSTLSISNEMASPTASIQIEDGKLLVIHRRIGSGK